MSASAEYISDELIQTVFKSANQSQTRKVMKTDYKRRKMFINHRFHEKCLWPPHPYSFRERDQSQLVDHFRPRFLCGAKNSSRVRDGFTENNKLKSSMQPRVSASWRRATNPIIPVDSNRLRVGAGIPDLCESVFRVRFMANRFDLAFSPISLAISSGSTKLIGLSIDIWISLRL